MEKRYGALRFIATIHKVAAGLVLVIGGFTAFGTFTRGMESYGVLAAIVAVVVAILLWAIAESILVVIDIEANTRRAADILANREAAPTTRA
jgi:uncharacterized membrane protein